LLLRRLLGMLSSKDCAVEQDLDWTAICADTYAIKRDGSLWSWGGASVPTRVGTGNSWKTVAAGFGDVFALKTGGSLWAWGVNGGGQLGLGDRVARTSPTRVRGGWAKVAVGDAWTLGLKSNGTFWSWGIDHAMQLGLPVVRTRGVPTRIFSLR
jgi:alpha-tubulin suppressor-like RCC1 family protein